MRTVYGIKIQQLVDKWKALDFLSDNKMHPVHDIFIVLRRTADPYKIEKIGLRTDGNYELQSAVGYMYSVRPAQEIEHVLFRGEESPIFNASPKPLPFQAILFEGVRSSNYERRKYSYVKKTPHHAGTQLLTGWGADSTEVDRLDTALNIFSRYLHLSWLEGASGKNLLREGASKLATMQAGDIWSEKDIRLFLRSNGYWTIFQ